jgi:PAS domain S-box-containing protein
MAHSIKILHLEDVQSDAELVERTLKRSGIDFEKVLVDTRDEFTHALKDFEPDVILSDHSLPEFNSLEALKLLKETGRDIPFILITATVSEEFAVNVMKEGASDYVLKDRLQRLPSAIINALGKFQSDADRQIYLNKIVASEALFTKAEIIAEFGTWRVDLANDVTTWSAGTYTLLGYEENEVEPGYENFIKNVHPDDLQFVENALKTGFKNARSGEVDFRIVNKDGSIRHVHTQYEFEHEERGHAVYLTGFNQDVTRQTLAQAEIQRHMEELQAASDRQTAILNAMPPNMVLVNEEGKIVAVNESWRKLTLEHNLGLPRYGTGISYVAVVETATGMDTASFKRIAKGLKEVITGINNEYVDEYSCYSHHKKLWFQFIAAPLKDKTRKGAVVLHVDITARKEAEELMLKSKANLQTIFENTDVAYVLCDPEHKIVSFNSRANQMALEQSGKKIKVGSQAFSYFPKNRIPHVKEAIHRVSENETINYETSYQLSDGTIKWFDAKWVGVADDNGHNIGFILAFNDITERKIAELERERITADLVQRNNDLEQFTYIVSHNLRAPVANIMGLSNLLNSVGEDDKLANERIKASLATSIHALDNMIVDLNRILQVSSRANERQEVVVFDDVMKDVMNGLHDIIEGEHVVINCDFKTAAKMMAVKSYMHSIFYNLVSNSIKYRRSEESPSLDIYTRRNSNGVEIVFKDNGKGIEERNLTDLFGLYKRFDSNVDGKGVGLFMTKMQIEAMGGSIDVESEPGVGSIFIVAFPDTKLVPK